MISNVCSLFSPQSIPIIFFSPDSKSHVRECRLSFVQNGPDSFEFFFFFFLFRCNNVFLFYFVFCSGILWRMNAIRVNLKSRKPSVPIIFVVAIFEYELLIFFFSLVLCAFFFFALVEFKHHIDGFAMRAYACTRVSHVDIDQQQRRKKKTMRGEKNTIRHRNVGIIKYMWVRGADTIWLKLRLHTAMWSSSLLIEHLNTSTCCKWNEAMSKRNANRIKVPMSFFFIIYNRSDAALMCLPHACAACIVCVCAFDPSAQDASEATMYMVITWSVCFLKFS